MRIWRERDEKSSDLLVLQQGLNIFKSALWKYASVNVENVSF